MSDLNQLLLKLDHKTNFNEHDFYISKVIPMHLILLTNGQIGKKEY